MPRRSRRKKIGPSKLRINSTQKVLNEIKKEKNKRLLNLSNGWREWSPNNGTPLIIAKGTKRRRRKKKSNTRRRNSNTKRKRRKRRR